MRPIFFAALFAFFFAMLPAYARLGETEDQCIARYGQGRVMFDGTNPARPRMLHFSRKGINIDVVFLNGIAAEISFGKDIGDLSADEIQALLDDNSQGLKWTKFKSQEQGATIWGRSDGAGAAYLTPTLTITSKAMLDRPAQTANPSTPASKSLQGL